MKLIIQIPCYNEEHTLPDTLVQANCVPTEQVPSSAQQAPVGSGGQFAVAHVEPSPL